MKTPGNKPQVDSDLCVLTWEVNWSWHSGGFWVSQLSPWSCHMAGFLQFTTKKKKTNNFYFMLSWNIWFSSFPVNYGGKKVVFLLVRIVVWNVPCGIPLAVFCPENYVVFLMVKFLQVQGYERYFKKSSFTLGTTTWNNFRADLFNKQPYNDL